MPETSGAPDARRDNGEFPRDEGLHNGEALTNGGVRRARIAIMLPRFSRYGGVEQFGCRLAEGLAGRGHAVDFICARKEADAPAGVRVLTVGRPPGGRFVKMVWFLIGAERLRKAGRYDLAVSLGKTWNQNLSRMGGGPLRVFWELSERALPEGRARLLKRLARRLSPANRLTLFLEQRQFTAQSDVIAVSHLVRDWLLRAHPTLEPGRVDVIYNRPDTSRFSPPTAAGRAASRKALAASCGASFPEEREPVCIGTASTNFQLKGVGPLIKALALLPEHVLLFVAGGRDSGGYKKLARSLGVGDRVFFLGKVDDMPAFYRALDVFILPTFYDACSNAVLEALASGCRTLTSASNGAAYFLPPDAVLADPGDVEAMAEKLALAMERPAPPPFAWPDTVPNGLEAFMDALEKRLRST